MFFFFELGPGMVVPISIGKRGRFTISLVKLLSLKPFIPIKFRL